MYLILSSTTIFIVNGNVKENNREERQKLRLSKNGAKCPNKKASS